MSAQNPDPFRPHLIRSAVFVVPLLASLLVWAVGVGFSVLAGLGSVSGGGGRDLLGQAVNSGLALFGLLGMVVFGTAWLLSLFVPVREVVAEDGMSVRDRASALDAVHTSILARVQRNCPPFTVRADTLDGHPSLVLGGEGLHALLVVRPVGPDARIGWTVWRSRSTSTLALEALAGRQTQNIALLDADAGAMLRDLLRAAVELVADQADH
jgi:hypothetical protein